MNLGLDPQKLHHAYLFAGKNDVLQVALEDFFIKSLLFPVQGNPDYWKESFESLGIDESRRIIEMHRGKPIAGEKRIFLIGAQNITREAQNALLKVLEEPVVATHFFFIVPSESILLPTVKSRMMSIRLISSSHSEGEMYVDAKKFLNASLKDRMKIAAMLAEEKNRSRVSEFLDGLETSVVQRTSTDKNVQLFADAVLKVRNYSGDRGASTKMLLEHLALTVPSGLVL
jgi:DNA polymerase III delta prime subunit